jgi:hypothetical protein
MESLVLPTAIRLLTTAPPPAGSPDSRPHAGAVVADRRAWRSAGLAAQGDKGALVEGIRRPRCPPAAGHVEAPFLVSWVFAGLFSDDAL